MGVPDWYEGEARTTRALIAMAKDSRRDAEARRETIDCLRIWFEFRKTSHALRQMEHLAFDESQPGPVRSAALEFQFSRTYRRSLSRRLGRTIENDRDPEVVFWAAYLFAAIGRQRDRSHIVRRLRNSTVVRAAHRKVEAGRHRQTRRRRCSALLAGTRVHDHQAA